jgi:hypothetical protein
LAGTEFADFIAIGNIAILSYYQSPIVHPPHSPLVKKKRPRQHIIADLSVNHVERYALLCGYSVERISQDYGIDLVIFTYDANGEIENGQIYVQLKATDPLPTLNDQTTIPFSLKRSDLELWLEEPMPYILILYDAQAEQAYWLYVQAFFAQREKMDLSEMGETVTVYLDKKQVINQAALKQFAQYKNNVLSQINGVIDHHD